MQRHQHDLPRTLAEISRLPVPFRQAVFLAVPPSAKASLWREHLETFLAPSADLTPAQRAVVRDAAAELPELMAAPRPDAQERIRALEGRFRELFTREQAGRVFGTLGPPEPPEGLPIPPDALPPSAG